MNVKHRILCTLIGVALLAVTAAACAEQVPSPTLKPAVTVEVVSQKKPAAEKPIVIQFGEKPKAEDVAKDAAADEAKDAAADEAKDAVENEVMTQVLEQAQQVEKIADLFNEEALQSAAEFLPKDTGTETLMLAEMYSLTLDNYDPDYGDIDVCVEFSVKYEDHAVLLGMIGYMVEGTDEIIWMPVRATVMEGNIMLSLPQEVLEQISGNPTATFVLLQNQ